MAAIEEIPGINGATLDLFRAARVYHSGDLLLLSMEELMERLDEANAEEDLVARLPSRSALESWRNAAKVFEGGPGRERAKLPAGVMKEVRSPGLPTARQMSSAQLREAGIPAADVPIGKLLAEVSAEMEPEVAVTDGMPSNGGGVSTVGLETESAVEPQGKEADQRDDAGKEEVDQRHAAGHRPGAGELKVREISAVRESQEREQFEALGESKPAQRRLEKRNHGMLHREPARVYLGALATLLAMVLGGVGFLAVGVALVYALYYEVPVPAVTLWILPAFPAAVVLHVTLGLRPRCRLCGQQLFRPKSCNKHVKAHRSPFGPIFAVALHALTRRWFRCMLCGTKQRLRE